MERISIVIITISLMVSQANGISPEADRPPPRHVENVERRSFIITFYCSCAVCTKQYSPERGGKGLTRMGNHPLAFRTAATGDPALLGKWILFDDLGSWIHINDTGKLKKNQLDIYVGQGPHMHQAARRLGRQEWLGVLR